MSLLPIRVILDPELPLDGIASILKTFSEIELVALAADVESVPRICLGFASTDAKSKDEWEDNFELLTPVKAHEWVVSLFRALEPRISVRLVIEWLGRRGRRKLEKRRSILAVEAWSTSCVCRSSKLRNSIAFGGMAQLQHFALLQWLILKKDQILACFRLNG